MKLFKRINSERVNEKLISKNIAKQSLIFVFGALISALSFNLFCLPNNFVSGSLGGIAVILNKLFSLNSSVIILLGNIVFIIISIFTLGFKESLMSIVGASVYTLFIYATADIPEMIHFSFDNILLYVLAAGVVGGFGEALVYKSGFNTGGTSIIAIVIQHYKKMPLGKILRIISVIIIASGAFVFGYTSVMYSIIITMLATYLVDKILIGISNSKTFFIQTSYPDEVADFVMKIIKSGVTELDIKGAYSHKRKKMLMCVVPTEKYTLLKDAIHEIDPDAFIVVSDCYEVLGGTKKEKIAIG